MNATGSDRPLRVAINALHAKSGGGVTYLKNVLKHFSDQPDLEFHLFLHEDQYDRLAPIPEGVHLHLFDFRSSFFRLLFWEQAALPLLIRRMPVDVTFSPANYGPIFAPRSVILLRNAMSVVTTDRRLRKQFYWLGVSLITFLSLAASRRAIAVSRFARSQLGFGAERLLRKRIDVIYHGVDPAYGSSGKPRPESPTLLAVGDIYIQKNLHGLISALPRIVARLPDVRLKIAGRLIDLEYYQRITDLTVRLKVDDRVDFLGYCDTATLKRLYNECSALVFASTVETFGNPLVEAMACGVAIASSNTSAMPEIVGDAGIFFDPGDPADIADRIVELVTDTAKADALSRRAMRRARQFSWEKTARATCDVLRDAAGRRG